MKNVKPNKAQSGQENNDILSMNVVLLPPSRTVAASSIVGARFDRAILFPLHSYFAFYIVKKETT